MIHRARLSVCASAAALLVVLGYAAGAARCAEAEKRFDFPRPGISFAAEEMMRLLLGDRVAGQPRGPQMQDADGAKRKSKATTAPAGAPR